MVSPGVGERITRTKMCSLKGEKKRTGSKNKTCTSKFRMMILKWPNLVD